MKRVALVVVALSLWAGIVWAHAILVRSDPAAGAALRSVPKIVRAWFSEELDPRRSVLSVWDSRGKRADDGKGGVDLDDLNRRSMLAHMTTTGDGTYIVRWQAVSADDGNVARGMFRFTVRR